MNKFRKQITALYSIIIVSVFVIIFSVGQYIKIEADINEELLEDYNYEEIQDIVIADELLNMPQYDIEQLSDLNEDFCGWIYIPDTPINYPVVQGNDNEYYLNHSFEKEYSKFGCIFMMAGASSEDDNIILHGHNMGKDREEMFSSLLEYEDEIYADSHKDIWFAHIDNELPRKYEVFAVVNYDFGNPDDFYYMIPNFSGEEEYRYFVDYLSAQSKYHTDFTPSGQLLILSTCYNIYGDNHRMLICAALKE